MTFLESPIFVLGWPVEIAFEDGGKKLTNLQGYALVLEMYPLPLSLTLCVTAFTLIKLPLSLTGNANHPKLAKFPCLNLTQCLLYPPLPGLTCRARPERAEATVSSSSPGRLAGSGAEQNKSESLAPYCPFCHCIWIHLYPKPGWDRRISRRVKVFVKFCVLYIFLQKLG